MFIIILINLKKFLKEKLDYAMSSIIGLDGLYPTIKIIKHTQKRSLLLTKKQ